MYWIICITTVSLHSSVGRQLDANISRLAGLELDERVIHGEVRKGTRTTSGEYREPGSGERQGLSQRLRVRSDLDRHEKHTKTDEELFHGMPS